ncbi:MAG: PAS domain-containing protein [Candidatus Moranbacteria bacterium]|nr:PAS domain-containing protein [Candidatus Moranbacteria bacterium]
MGDGMMGLMAFFSLLKSTPDSMVWKKYRANGNGGVEGGEIEFASMAKARHYNLDMQSIRGKTDFDLMLSHEQAQQALRDDIWVIQNNKAIEDREEIITHENGGDAIISVSKFPWTISDEKKVIGSICTARDITIRKKAMLRVSELETLLLEEILPFLESLAEHQDVVTALIQKIKKMETAR